jgi:nucleoside-diphosphate-sugar epimerase
MPTIFVTGAAGYIGGHTVNLIAKVHPDWELVALVRTEEQAKIIQKQWPAIKAVVGSLDDHALVSEHSASADVVLRMYALRLGLHYPLL